MSQRHTPNKQDDIRRVALNLLTRRDHSKQELIQKLSLKGYPLEQINRVLSDLAEVGLLNEERFVESFIRWRRDRGYGPERIRAELHGRGIPPEMIAQHLQMADNAWLIEVRRIWQKHFRGKVPTEYKARAKQMRFLQYRGYTRDQIASVFNLEEHEI